MWPTSDAFREALAAPHRRWHSRVDVLTGGTVVEALDVLVTGSVSLDDVAVRRAARLTLVDSTGRLAPADAHDLLAPMGTEVRPFRGLELADGSVEWVPLGVMGIKEPTISALPGGGTQVQLSCTDRVDALRARRFTEPWRIAAGTPTHEAIAAIVQSRMTVEARLTATGHTTPELTYDALSDPWDAVDDLAKADALAAFFGPMGTLTVAPDVATETDVVYEPGPGSFLVSGERSMSSEATYSGVRVTVEHPDQDPIVVVVWDEDPTSPTYHLGPFGARPYGFSSQAISSPEQASSVAANILPRVTRLRQEATMTTVGHPGHEIGDVVTVTHPATRTSGRWVVVGGSIPVRTGAIALKLREAL